MEEIKMTDINKFIDSIENELFNRIRNSKSDAEARRLLKEQQALQLLQPDVIKSVCDRANNFENNRCINCGAKAGHKCELQTVL